MPWLIALDGEHAGRRFSLDSPCLVGRGPYNHIVLDDTRISRQHAKISPENGGHVVYDLNSANGTFVNEQQVRRQRLRPTDTLRFGPFNFKFETSEATSEKKQPRFVEVLTSIGESSKIVETLDAVVMPGTMAGLAELEDADRKLRTLYGFMQSIATTLDMTELLDRILRNLLEVFPAADMVSIYLADDGSGQIEPRQVLRRDNEPSQLAPLPVQVIEEVVQKSKAILSAPATSAPRRKAAGLSMHAPIIFNGMTQGLLAVRGNDHAGAPFSQHDLDLLTGLTAQAGLALQNARMHQDLLAQQRLQQDLKTAKEIQHSFLPQILPQVPGLEFIAEYRPAHSVGGDFYDIFWLSHDKLGIFIGDVSGKGVSAALLMARIASEMRVAALAEPDPARALGRVNRATLERRRDDIFVTGILCALDVQSHELVIANAGHLPPIIRHEARGALQRIDEGAGTAIGLFEDAVFEQVRLYLEPGDALILCTDGVIEATSPQGEQFGFERFERSLQWGQSHSRSLSDRLMRDVKTHVGSAPQYDDLTLLVCGVSSGAVEPVYDDDSTAGMAAATGATPGRGIKPVTAA